MDAAATHASQLSQSLDSIADTELAHMTVRHGEDVISVTITVRGSSRVHTGRLRSSWTPRLRSGLAERRFAEALDPSTSLGVGE